MKIGILTFHTPINYGAILQAYALQKYLKTSYPEFKVVNIDFKTDAHIKKYRIFIPFRRNVILYIYHQTCILFRYHYFKKRRKEFVNFLNEEFTLTERLMSIKDFLNNVPKMDIYVVGSDQVFHPNSSYTDVFYLNFKKYSSKKIAYAPSFGTSTFNNEDEKNLKPLLEDFDILSCRETDGAFFISKILKKEVPVVLDPIFLLSPSQWAEMSNPRKGSDKYIFVYDLNGGYELIAIANKIKSKTGFDIICQTQTAHNFYDVDKQLFDSGPREFVDLIMNADYVVTDSFHGCAFSILFNRKQFIYIARPEASTRIRSIMELFGLSDNIVEFSKSEDFDFILDAPFDYSELLNDEILKSKKFLNNSIQTAK